MTARRWLAGALVLAACVTVPRASSLRPAERSSIDAVLRHAVELALSDAQVSALHELDDVREAKVRELQHHPQGRAGPARHGRRGGAWPRQPDRGPHRVPAVTPALLAFEAAADELDTQAWLGAEALLTPVQRDAARVIVSAWREALFTWRHHRPEFTDSSRSGR